MTLALQSPKLVTGLVLASGYYYPTVRPVFAVASIPALLLIDDVIAWTITPLIGRLMGPLLEEKVFGPQQIEQTQTDDVMAAINEAANLR